MATAVEQMPAKTTTINALKRATVMPEIQNPPVVRSGFDNLQSFELMQRGAKLLASSTLVPEIYRGNLANCVIALNMARRIGADELMVMQNLYMVHGRPAWSAQFVIACFNKCGRFSSMKYRWFSKPAKQGDIPDAWGCQAYAKELETDETIEGPVITIAMAKKEGWYQKNGSKWQTIPELMLMYRAGSWLVRTHAPDISMGLQTAEELGDVYDATRGKDGTFAVTLDTLRDDVPVGTPEPDPNIEQKIEEQAQELTLVEDIDKTTGEVKNAHPRGEPMPGFDEKKAVKLLRGAKSRAALDDANTGIEMLLNGGDRPLSITAAYEEMCEKLDADVKREPF